jgi:Leucine-rich repeat (LRR) protein
MARVLSQETIKKKSGGHSPHSIKRLNLWGQRLTDISILRDCQNLEILSLSYNQIQDITPLKHCTALKELYLIKNNITSMADLSNLTGAKDLRILCIDENPICSEVSNLRLKL